MAIEYSKVGWDVAPYKYANPDNMNKMDTGIKSAVDGVNALEYVPSALEEIKVLGWSVPKAVGVYNTIDTSRQLHLKVDRIELGSLSWYYNGSYFVTVIDNAKGYGKSYCSKYAEPTSGTHEIYLAGGGNVVIFDSSYTSVDTLKSSLGGVYLYYELSAEKVIQIEANEIATDIENLKVLGYTIPKEMSVRNYVDSGRNLHVKVGRVDLGTLGWSHFDNPSRWGAILYGVKDWGNGYCIKYQCVNTSADKTISMYSNWVTIYDNSYSDANALKESLKGIEFYYELATEYVIPLDGSEVVNDTECLKYLGWTVPKQLAVKNVAKVGGGLHQRVGRVDLGTLNWVNNNGYFYNLNGISYKATSNSIPFNAYTSKYVTKSLDYIASQVGDKCIGASYDGYLCIRDTSYSDATALRNSLSGQYLYYELGTSVEIAEGNEIGILRYDDVTISASSVSAYSDVRATVTVPSGYTPISVVSLTNNNAEFVPYIRKVSDTSYTIIVRNTTSSTLNYQANTYRVVMARL